MSERILLQGGSVFDGTGSMPAIVDIVLASGRILAVGTGLDADRAVQLNGFGVLPGFVDCHIHAMVSSADATTVANTAPSYRLLQAAQNLRRTLAAGVTTARDADGADAGLRQALADGLVQGPQLLVSIAMLSQTGGRGDHWMPAGFSLPVFDVSSARPDGIADGPVAVRLMARRLIRAGADVLKVATSMSALAGSSDLRCAQFREDEMAEAVAEATAAGIPVMAHSHSAAGAAMAVAHGVHSIEHGSNLTDETIESMVRRGTWLVPTLAAGKFALAAEQRRGSPSPEALSQLTEFVARHAATVARAHRAGVRIALGSDSGVVPHGSNLSELAALVEAGLTASEALVAGTSAGAALLGLDDELGTIEVGKRAHLVVVEGDPLEVSSLPDRLTAVLRDGRLVAGRLPGGAQ